MTPAETQEAVLSAVDGTKVRVTVPAFPNHPNVIHLKLDSPQRVFVADNPVIGYGPVFLRYHEAVALEVDA